MIDEEGIFVQFCYLPDLSIFGQVVRDNGSHLLIKYVYENVVSVEMFDSEDVVLTKEIHIPFEREVEE